MSYKIEPNRFYLYKITNLVNNKIYIGQTDCPERRWSQHKSIAKHNIDCPGECQVITRAIIKHKIENFTFEIIASSWTQEFTNEAEEILIKQYDSRKPEIGYNIAIGGNKTTCTPEISQKISEGLLKYYETHESTLKGRPMTEEWKKHISEASMGKPGTNTGKTFSNEWRVKLSKSQAGKDAEDKRRFSKETELEICRLYVEEKKSIYRLAEDYDCYRSLIIAILGRNNIKKRESNYTGHKNMCNRFTKEQEKEICSLYEKGNISRNDLAKQFNCGKTTVREILLRNGVKL
jgi:group I intron endonuclease